MSLKRSSTAIPGNPSRTEVMEPELRRGVHLGDPSVGEGPTQLVEKVGRAGLAAERHLLERREDDPAAACFGEQEAPEGRGRADAGDPVVEEGVEPVLGLAREGGDQRRLAGDDVEQHLDAGELMQAVGEQPALVGRRADAGHGLGQDPPIVAGRFGQARRTGGADHERLGGLCRERRRGAGALALGRWVGELLGPDRHEVLGRDPARRVITDVEAEGIGLLGQLGGGCVGLELAGLGAGEGGTGEEAYHPGRVGLGQREPRDAATAQRAGDTPARRRSSSRVGRGAFGGDDGGPIGRCGRRGLEQKDHSVRTAA